MTELFPGLCVLAVLVRILSIRTPVSLLSPVYGLVAVYLTVLCLGGFIYDPHFEGGGGVFPVSTEDCYSLATDVVWLLCAFVAGAVISNEWGRQGRTRKKLSFFLPIHAISKWQGNLALLFGTAALVFAVFGNGVSNIIQRSEYLPESNHIFKIIGQSLLPAAILGFGATYTSKGVFQRWQALCLGVAAMTLALALNTRMFALTPILFFIGALIADRRKVSMKYGLLISVFLAPLLMIVPLVGREMPKQGLAELPELAVQLTEVRLDGKLHELANNVFISAPITIESIKANVGDKIDYFLLEINPLPGYLVKWDVTVYMANPVTPFSAVGDVLRPGVWFGVCYFAVIGMYFGLIERKIQNAKRLNAPLLSLTAISYLYIILSVQYPLRNVTRLIYYMLLIEALLLIVYVLAPSKRRQKSDRKTFGYYPRQETPTWLSQ